MYPAQEEMNQTTAETHQMTRLTTTKVQKFCQKKKVVCKVIKNKKKV